MLAGVLASVLAGVPATVPEGSVIPEAALGMQLGGYASSWLKPAMAWHSSILLPQCPGVPQAQGAAMWAQPW